MSLSYNYRKKKLKKAAGKGKFNGMWLIKQIIVIYKKGKKQEKRRTKLRLKWYGI